MLRRLLLPVLAACALSSFAFAQDNQMFQGGGAPLTMKPTDLTPQFHAMTLATASGSGNGLLDMIMSPMMMMMGALGAMGGQAQSEGPPMSLLTAMSLSWTTGQTQAYFGQTFLVTYKLDVDLDTIGKAKDLTSSNLRMTLVRVDTIQAFTPRPDITPTMYLQMLKVPKPAAPAKATGSGKG